ncbi:nitrate reductase molybdenum cofactor assembly chaperone [Aquincola sp. S2]|uniref:Nitrate reductase molybdenum cofactor assembly chaperone n=1 Tax=Pseudaquabacterium terrae TaxID=2732868 RepID=A0ABX2ER84_9BURK|nr:nitrate reductase molybdenum cofactor assembly chaperone [Aquabacterium terrae]NRF71021.1 nitrate reductase molybdenum cofactor assembly chaperone [Aquabacterium terrae]
MSNAKRLTKRVLAALLRYPDADFRAAIPDLRAALAAEGGLPRPRLAELDALLRQLQAMDPFEAESRFVDTFDRGRATSLHVFEHVHGDSRDRGPAMVDLGQMYERAGLLLGGDELPDHLSVVLEFASTQPERVAREFLGEMAHILNAVFSALRERENPYASVIAAVLELAGQKVQAVPVVPDEDMDQAWAEPPAFDGCSSRGQASPGTPQPIQIVRSTKANTTTSQGASA